MNITRFAALLLLAFSLGCSAEAPPEPEVYDGPGGKADDAGEDGEGSIYAIGNRLDVYTGDDHYLEDVQPVFAQRCVSCHGCGDSPCQLKLSSFEGVLRGSNDDTLYGVRVFSIDHEHNPAHLDHGRVIDQESGLVNYAATESRWRDLDYYSVADRGADSVLGRVLGEAHDVTENLDQSYEIAETLGSRDYECTGDDPRARDLVGRAMPLGLPALHSSDTRAVQEWLGAGSPGVSDDVRARLAEPANPAAIEEWENFFNPESGTERDRLIARYIHEHVFFAHLHFQRSPGEFYRLIRSRTRTGPVDAILTELPNDRVDGDVYYRLVKYTAVIAAKSHIVMELSPERMDAWNEIMYDADWELIEDHPEYDARGENPFEYFASIPSEFRYRFMLNTSKELVDGMVRGSVCVGNSATFAIRDRFWVWFLDPSADPSAQREVNGTEIFGPLLNESSWFHLNPNQADALREIDYLRAYRRYLQQHRPQGLSVSDLWNGDGTSPDNAWLTITRHGESASVQNGAHHGHPETLWILNYSNFERLFYDLVVEFETWGPVLHKKETWDLMSLIRSEGEDLARTLLPPGVRDDVANHHLRGWGNVDQLLYPTYASCSGELEDIIGDCDDYGTAVDYSEIEAGLSPEDNINAHLASLERQVREHIGGIALDVDTLNDAGGGDLPETVSSRSDVDAAFNAMTGRRSAGWEHFPDLMTIRVRGPRDQIWLYTLLATRIYSAHNRIYLAGLTRRPEEDTVSAARGIIGEHPGLFIDVKADGMRELVTRMLGVQSEQDWADFVHDYAEGGGDIHVIGREDPAFWAFLDDVHREWFANDPINAGVLDVRRYIWPQDLVN